MHPSRLARSLVSGMLVLCTFSLPGCDDQGSVSGPSVPNPTTGAIRVSVSIFGNGPDLDGFLVRVRSGQPSDPSPLAMTPSGGTVFFPDLPPGTYEVQAESLAENCRLSSSEPVQVVLIAGLTALVPVAVLCPASVTTEILLRYDWDGNPMLERYFLEEDGSFELDFGGWFALGGEFFGSYSREGDVYTFEFGSDFPREAWDATGSRDGDCLNLDYNDSMNLSDFEDGWYCLEYPGADRKRGRLSTSSRGDVTLSGRGTSPHATHTTPAEAPTHG